MPGASQPAAYRPTRQDEVLDKEMLAAEHAIGQALDNAPISAGEPGRTVTLAVALSTRILESSAWCHRCRAEPEQLCGIHADAASLVHEALQLTCLDLPATA